MWHKTRIATPRFIIARKVSKLWFDTKCQIPHLFLWSCTNEYWTNHFKPSCNRCLHVLGYMMNASSLVTHSSPLSYDSYARHCRCTPSVSEERFVSLCTFPEWKHNWIQAKLSVKQQNTCVQHERWQSICTWYVLSAKLFVSSTFLYSGNSEICCNNVLLVKAYTLKATKSQIWLQIILSNLFCSFSS